MLKRDEWVDLGRAFAAESEDGVLAMDRELRYVFWNPAMERLLGMRADEVLGRPALSVLPFLVESGEPELFRRVLAGESVRAPDRRFTSFDRNGEQRHGCYDARYTPWRSGSGDIIGVVGTIRDITARKQADQHLQEIESRFRNMADASPVMLWMSGRDTQCTFFNQTWLAFTGRTLEEEWGVGWAEGVHPEDLQRCMDTYLAAFTERRVFEMEYRLRRSDGEYRWILDRGAPRYTPDGSFAGYIGSCVDVTDRKQLEADLRQAVRARDEFFSIASHELRTPLTSLQLQIESITRALRRDPAHALQSGRLARRANAAATQADRMGMLVDAMLDVSRIAGGRLPLEYDDADAAAIARDVAARMAAAAAEVGSTVEVQGPAHQTGRWDPLRLDQVLANLLSNAIKYGGGQPITVTLGGDTAQLTIAVRDRGIGIEPEHQARIFERFERAVSAHNYGGFGLGLWICRRIVEAMEGAISVESAPGQGATFTVMLPRRPDACSPAAARATAVRL
jgi:PAS domain S-box-containing protein